MLASMNVAVATTCNDLKVLYNTNECCSASPPVEICSAIPYGDELANVFNTLLRNSTDDSRITSSHGITSSNINDVTWNAEDEYYAFNYQDATLRSNLQKNLAILSALDPEEFKIILTLSLDE